jgi:hypothetical protein
VTLAAAPGKPDAFSKKFSIIGTMLMEFEMQNAVTLRRSTRALPEFGIFKGSEINRRPYH